jgi:glycosyltransferase involved in cell wall biosynthesis
MHPISILMPVYNAARYLPAAVESVLAQSYRDFELVAVDDGSTDGSHEILRRYARRDRRIRVISRPNTGIVGALNDAASVATGQLLARLDADDIAAPERLERQNAYMSGNPDCVALGSSAWIIDSDGAVVDLIAPPGGHAEIEGELMKGNGGAILHPAAMFRRDAFERIGGYDPAFRAAEDVDLYFRLIPEGRLANLPEPLIRYRQHTKSINFTIRAEQKRILSRILYREAGRRHLSPNEQTIAAAPADLGTAGLHRQWACTSCRYGTPSTALKHAFLGLCNSPTEHRSWSVLRYVFGRAWSRAKGRADVAGGTPASLP